MITRIPGVPDVVIRAQGWLYEVDDEFLRERECRTSCICLLSDNEGITGYCQSWFSFRWKRVLLSFRRYCNCKVCPFDVNRWAASIQFDRNERCRQRQ